MEAALETVSLKNGSAGPLDFLRQKLKDKFLAEQLTCDDIPTLWVERHHLIECPFPATVTFELKSRLWMLI